VQPAGQQLLESSKTIPLACRFKKGSWRRLSFTQKVGAVASTKTCGPVEQRNKRGLEDSADVEGLDKNHAGR
jgi:hypothetical protein